MLLGASSCVARGNVRPVETLTIASPSLEQAALIYVAVEQGFYAANGLNVVVKDYDTGPASLDALLDGDADIAEAAEYPFVRLALRGEPVTLIACNDQFENDYVVVRPGAGISAASDLAGKRVGVAKGTIAEFYLARLLELRGISVSEVVDVRPEGFVKAIAGGDLDALVAWQPYVAQMQKQNSGLLVLPAQSGQAAFGVLAGRSDWVGQHGDVVGRFLAALRQSEDYLVRHPAEAQAIVRRRLKYDPAYVGAIWPQHEFSLSLDQPLVIAMKDEAQWMIRNGLAGDSAMPDFGQHIYTAALEAAKPGAVTLVR